MKVTKRRKIRILSQDNASTPAFTNMYNALTNLDETNTNRKTTKPEKIDKPLQIFFME